MNVAIEPSYETPKASIESIDFPPACDRKSRPKRHCYSFTTPQELIRSFDASAPPTYESPRKKQRSLCEASEPISYLIGTAPQFPDSPALEGNVTPLDSTWRGSQPIRRRPHSQNYDSLLASSAQLFSTGKENDGASASSPRRRISSGRLPIRPVPDSLLEASPKKFAFRLSSSNPFCAKGG